MSITVPNLPFQFVLQDSASGATGFMFKSTHDAFIFDGVASTVTKITDVDYPTVTVPGVAFLDGYFFVMDAAGVIYNSDLEAPLSWNSLDFIRCEAEPDGGVAIAKYENYIVGFGRWTTQFFYDAANPLGSPLSPIESSTIQIGCANGYSVVQFDGKLVWMGNSREKGRGVYACMGSMTPVEVSDPNISRILNADNLAEVYSWGAGFSGHSLYVLSLVASGITLVYDFSTKAWSHFTRRVASQKSVSALSQTGGVATVTSTAHGFADGDEVTHAGANQAGYNITANITYIDANSYSFPVAAATVSPATGTITATGSTEGYFDLHYYASVGGKDIVQGGTDGIIYEVLGTAHQDNGVSIDVTSRTAIFDANTADRKATGSGEIIGDKVDATGLLRWSDDDYTTSSSYRQIDLGAHRARIRRLGSSSRRSYEIRHTANTSFRVEALELKGE
jgi:hypothetical protein